MLVREGVDGVNGKEMQIHDAAWNGNRTVEYLNVARSCTASIVQETNRFENILKACVL